MSIVALMGKTIDGRMRNHLKRQIQMNLSTINITDYIYVYGVDIAFYRLPI